MKSTIIPILFSIIISYSTLGQSQVGRVNLSQLKSLITATENEFIKLADQNGFIEKKIDNTDGCMTISFRSIEKTSDGSSANQIMRTKCINSDKPTCSYSTSIKALCDEIISQIEKDNFLTSGIKKEEDGYTHTLYTKLIGSDIHGFDISSFKYNDITYYKISYSTVPVE